MPLHVGVSTYQPRWGDCPHPIMVTWKAASFEGVSGQRWALLKIQTGGGGPLPLSRTSELPLGLLWQMGTLWHVWQLPQEICTLPGLGNEAAPGRQNSVRRVHLRTRALGCVTGSSPG